jgi:Ca-activated chloride channel homolog
MTKVRHALSLLALGSSLLALMAAAPASAAEIKLDAELGQSVLETRSSQTVYLRLNLKALAAAREAKRQPVNVALVLDRSGSMQGARIAAAKEAARMALDRLNANDMLSVVMFNNQVDVLQAAGPVGDSSARLRDKISSIKADGGTAIYAGVREGASQARRYLNPARVNRVILMSDGLANVGPSSPKELGELGREIASKGISVTTIGLGLDYNEDLMQRLASASDGNHAFAKEPEDLIKFFNAEFGDALSVVAQDIEITIEIKSGFKAKRVLSREADITGQTIKLKLNALQSDNERYVVIELENAAPLTEGTASIAAVDVDYFDIDSGQRAHIREQASMRAYRVRRPMPARASTNRSQPRPPPRSQRRKPSGPSSCATTATSPGPSASSKRTPGSSSAPRTSTAWDQPPLQQQRVGR